MITSFLLVASLLPVAADPERSATEPAKLSAYETAKAEARPGNDAEAHVRLALWCEANGLRPERLRHLALAFPTSDYYEDSVTLGSRPLAAETHGAAVQSSLPG